MHHRLLNECAHRLARFALSVVAPCLREEEHRDAFAEFYTGFRDTLVWYETARERMAVRLRRADRHRRVERPRRAEGQGDE